MGNLCSKLERSNSVHEGTRTRQYDIFQSQFDKLVTCVGPSVGEVARKAFVKNLIDQSTMEAALNQHFGTDVRTTGLLSVILRKIEERANHFDMFTKILGEIPTCKDKAEELDCLVNGTLQLQEVQQGKCRQSRVYVTYRYCCTI